MVGQKRFHAFGLTIKELLERSGDDPFVYVITVEDVIDIFWILRSGAGK